MNASERKTAVGAKRAARAATMMAAALLVAACGAEPQAQAPKRAGEPLDPLRTAERLAQMRSQAMAGDQEALHQSVSALNQDIQRSIRLADPQRKVDRENARIAARSVHGVRSVVWLDNENLFAIVEGNPQRSYGTIDAICARLDPLGDTLGVVVNLQSGAASSGDELEILSRNCQLPPGERAFAQAHRQVDALSPQARAQHRANADAALRHERASAREESERIIQASTPEM